jgi:aspartate aminotransferase-like enzyme
MRAESLRDELHGGEGPRIVCAQAGEVNTGAFDPLEEIAEAAVLRAVQESGEAWMSGTTWQGRQAIRISVSNWSTSHEDVDRTISAFARAAASNVSRRRPTTRA